MKKHLLTTFIIFSAFSPAFGEEFDYASTLTSKGAGYCSKAINSVANWLVEQDAFGLSTWHAANPAEHSGSVLISKRFKDSNGLLNLSATPTKTGGCDVSFAYIVPVRSACTSLRETAFKDWKYNADLQGLALYDDPTTNNVSVVLQSISDVCLITKTGVVFYDKSELK